LAESWKGPMTPASLLLKVYYYVVARGIEDMIHEEH
jgi:hypothetical protein